MVLPSVLLLLASSSSLLQSTFAQESIPTTLTPPTLHSFSSLRLPHHPAPRSYSTHTYYVVELDPSSSVSPSEAARQLGTQLVERVGELDHHYLVRKELNSLGKRDERVWNEWRGAKSKRAQGGGEGSLSRGAVRSLEEMKPKMRVKRSWEEPAGVEERVVSRRISGRQEQEDLTEINHLVSSTSRSLPSLISSSSSLEGAVPLLLSHSNARADLHLSSRFRSLARRSSGDQRSSPSQAVARRQHPHPRQLDERLSHLGRWNVRSGSSRSSHRRWIGLHS